MKTTLPAHPCHYGLLRHGETVWNSEKRVQGHGDSPLTTSGKESLRKWAEKLAHDNWQRIVCSDLGRVQETVAIINERLGIPVSIDERLREQNWGNWEGAKVSDVRRDFADELAIQVKRGWDFQPPGGESRRAMRERVFAALEASRTAFPEQRILVICHLGVIKSIIYAIANRRFLEDEPQIIAKDSMHTIRFDGECYHLDTLNITADDGR